jgi:serpin B
MIVFLPNAVDGLPAFEQSLNAATMEQWLGQLQPASGIMVTLPKFKMEAQFGLNDTLSAMGMWQAFNPRMSDFTGMASRGVTQHDGNLYISAVIHKAYVDVNEEGSEAVATTGIATPQPTAALPPPHIVFRADHPFVFLIRDNGSGSILFMGRVTDPSK